MSNYSQIVLYGPKDSLALNDANKFIKGVQIDAELGAISTAISTKYDAGNLGAAPTQTFTNQQIFSQSNNGALSAVLISAGSAALGIKNTSGAADAKQWDIATTSTDMVFRTINDANSAAKTWLDVTRAANVITAIAVGGADAPTTTFSGPIIGGKFQTATGVTGVTGSGTPVNFFNMTGIPIGVYIVSVTIPSSNDVTNYSTTAIVTNLASTSKATILQTAGLMTISSGFPNITATQGSGGSAAITWYVTRIV